MIFQRLILPLSGFAVLLLLWHGGILLADSTTPLVGLFSPASALQALVEMLLGTEIWYHILLSLQRVGVGLLLAIVIGVPLGILVASWVPFAKATSPLFQFLRMISPLSWMPVAVMVFGIGDAPVYFLLAFAAVWPIMLNTAAGVAQIDPNWLLLGKSLSATRRETVMRILLPASVAHILTGVRLAIGIIWIVLVPAEMLGVSAGLGYFILDTRDRLAYSELMAAIIIIGFLGFALDYLARALYRRWLHTPASRSA